MTQRENRKSGARSQNDLRSGHRQQRGPVSGSMPSHRSASRVTAGQRDASDNLNSPNPAVRSVNSAYRASSHHAANRPVGGRHSRQSQGAVNPIDSHVQPQPISGRRNAAVASTSSFSRNVGDYSRYSTDYSQRRTGMSRRKKVGVTLLLTFLVIGVVGLGVFVFKEYQKGLLNDDLHSGMSEEELIAIDSELTGLTKFDEPFTVLLLGSDARSYDPSMGARTDTIVLVRIDPLINNITMLSIPRDTRIYIDDVGYEKFNAAYTYGGAKGTIAAVKDLCDVEIDHYAEINFEGLVGLIDAIGGIDVFVDETIDDPDAGNIVIPAGEQHLDGEAALVFSRSRAYADGDYTRVSNQRKVIEAIIRRGLEAPSSELYGLIRQSASFLKTDSAMTIEFIFSLADQIRHNNDYPITITTATLPSYAQYISGVSYVIADNQAMKDIIKIFNEGGDIAAFMEDYEIPSTGAADTTSSSSTGYSSGYGNGYDTSNGYGTGYGTSYDNGYGYDYGSGNNSGYDAGYDTGSSYESGGYDSTGSYN